MAKIRVGIIGATGYAGAELCRLIWGHPQAELAAISSVSFEGMGLSQVYPAYSSLIDLECQNQDAVVENSDVVFAALPAGISQALAAVCVEKNKVFIDLGADFRLEKEADYSQWYGGSFLDKGLHAQAVYGLPELFRDKIRGQKLIANPGCYTTAVPLALAPAILNDYVETAGIIADCKSGVTGAGRKPSQGNHFPELNESFYAYKIASHRHTPEIEQTLGYISGHSGMQITFIPHLLPVNRGILATCYAKLKPGVTQEMLWQAYQAQYENEWFIRLQKPGTSPNIRNVRYTNFCDIAFTVDERTGTLIAISAIDNMVKGAAGQAIQNMNLCFDLEETAGLRLVPPAF